MTKQLFPFLTLLSLIALTLVVGCKKDEFKNVLNYDGDNNGAPELANGIYVAAARFPASVTAEFEGRQLEAVEFYLRNVPASTEILIFDEGTANSPGSILSSANVSALVTPDSWYRHELAFPVDIKASDLWIGVRVDHPETFASVGCDPGPAVSNGDLMLVNNGSEWTTLRNFTNGEVDINWNIRGFVREE